MITHSANINGIEVEAVYSSQTLTEIILPLLVRLEELQKSKNRRILVMLAAPPGAGKSTLLSFIETLSAGTEESVPIQVIGMDGFHRPQEYLLNHTVVRDGEEIPMVRIKGAPVTFDLDHLKERVRMVSSGGKCGWPAYDRHLHNPIEDAVEVDAGIVILEGNYLLLDEDGWRDLRSYADYTIFCGAEPDFLRERLIARRMKTGVSEEESIRFVDFSDMPNVMLCLQNSSGADLELYIDRSGEYHIVDL